MKETENELDKNFKELQKISLEIFEIAKEKMLTEKVIENIKINKYKDQLVNLLKDVNFINELEAKRLVSEAMLDLDYISKKEVRILSMRLGSVYRKQEKIK